MLAFFFKLSFSDETILGLKFFLNRTRLFVIVLSVSVEQIRRVIDDN